MPRKHQCYQFLCKAVTCSLGFSDLGPSSEFGCPLRWFKRSLTFPIGGCPGWDSILGPCGHGAEALLDEPPNHVRKSVMGTSSLDREPEKGVYFSERQRPLCWACTYIGRGARVLGVRLHSPVLGYVFAGIDVGGWARLAPAAHPHPHTINKRGISKY